MNSITNSITRAVLSTALFTVATATWAHNAASSMSGAPRIIMTLENVRVAGQTFVPLDLASMYLKAPHRYRQEAQQNTSKARTPIVEIGRRGRLVRFRLGSPKAMVNGRLVQLPVAPFRKDENTMIPLRLVADALQVPVQFDSRTDSLVITPPGEERPTILPLPTNKTGVVLHSPVADSQWHRTIRVQGQAKLRDGHINVQVQSASGEVLQESEPMNFGSGTSGQFREFIVLIGRAKAPGTSYPARVVARSQSNTPGAAPSTVTVPITFHEQ